MKKLTILYILLIVLFLSNVFFIFHHVGRFGHKDHKPHFSMVEELNFNQEQQEVYKTLRSKHFDKMKSYSKRISELKKEIYSNVGEQELSEGFLDSVVDLIALEEKNKDLEMYKHFRDVREICNDKQKAQLSKIINDAIERRGKRGKSKKRD
jgi:protein CpxP